MVILVESCQPSMSESIQNFGFWRARGKCKETCERHDERNCQTCLSVFRLYDAKNRAEQTKINVGNYTLDPSQKSGLQKKKKKKMPFW